MDLHSINTFAASINRSVNFVRAGIRLGKLSASMVGNQWVLPGSEARRFNKEPFKITRKDLER